MSAKIDKRKVEDVLSNLEKPITDEEYKKTSLFLLQQLINKIK